MLIGVIAFALIVLLIALLTDWSKLIQRFFIRSDQSKQVKSFVFDDEPVELEVLQPEPLPPLAGLPPVEVPTYDPESEIGKLLEEAEIRFRKGEMTEAEDLYVQVAAKDPRCSKAYARLGVIYLENGENWDDAEAAFRQAIKYDAQNGFVLNNLGLVLYHQDKYADAIRQFEQAVRLEELNAARHANLGMAYMAMRQYAKAESSFKKALKLNPAEMEYKDLLNESMEKKKAHKTMIRH